MHGEIVLLYFPFQFTMLKNQFLVFFGRFLFEFLQQ